MWFALVNSQSIFAAAHESGLGAGYVDRILRGEKASELPIQTPVKYQTVVNLKAARAIGLTVPTSVLASADEVIE